MISIKIISHKLMLNIGMVKNQITHNKPHPMSSALRRINNLFHLTMENVGLYYISLITRHFILLTETYVLKFYQAL